METKSLSILKLYKKLNEIMKAIDYLQKDKRNTFHGYDYLSEEAIKKALHKELADKGVLFNLQIIDVKKDGTITSITTHYKFIDIETGDMLEGLFRGDGEDKGDKGLYKAITGSIKYILTSQFLIPTGDDPEKDNSRSAKIPLGTPLRESSENTTDNKEVESVPVIQAEDSLPIEEDNKDVFVGLLSELNAVKNKETYNKAKELMDKISKQLTPEQIKTAIGIIATIGKKFNK